MLHKNNGTPQMTMMNCAQKLQVSSSASLGQPSNYSHVAMLGVQHEFSDFGAARVLAYQTEWTNTSLTRCDAASCPALSSSKTVQPR